MSKLRERLLTSTGKPIAWIDVAKRKPKTKRGRPARAKSTCPQCRKRITLNPFCARVPGGDYCWDCLNADGDTPFTRADETRARNKNLAETGETSFELALPWEPML